MTLLHNPSNLAVTAVPSPFSHDVKLLLLKVPYLLLHLLLQLNNDLWAATSNLSCWLLRNLLISWGSKLKIRRDRSTRKTVPWRYVWGAWLTLLCATCSFIQNVYAPTPSLAQCWVAPGGTLYESCLGCPPIIRCCHVSQSYDQTKQSWPVLNDRVPLAVDSTEESLLGTLL